MTGGGFKAPLTAVDIELIAGSVNANACQCAEGEVQYWEKYDTVAQQNNKATF